MTTEDVVMKDVVTAPLCAEASPPLREEPLPLPPSDPLPPPVVSLKDGSSTTWIDSLLPVPTLDPYTPDIRTNAFAQFVQGWENYMNDDDMMDPFQQPLQILQGLSLCGHPTAFPRIKAGPIIEPSLLIHPPSTLRYTYSSPTQTMGRKNSSVLDSANGEPFPPPPVALDPFTRSSSTPSAFRQHTTSFLTPHSGSAFTSPRCSGFVPVGRESSTLSTFGPVDFYSMALEDMERTSIEVQDISDGAVDTELKDRVRSKRGPASRAAKFLKDVRVLRRRRRHRGGRENPVQPAFPEKEEGDLVDHPMDTAVTVLTETVFNPETLFHPNDTSFLLGDSEISVAPTPSENEGATDVEDNDTGAASGLNMSEEKEETADQQYQQFDSDMEEEVGYQLIEAPSTSPLVDRKLGFFDRPSQKLPVEDLTIRIQEVVSTSRTKPRFAMAMEATAASPTRMDTPSSQEEANMSPHTTPSVSSSGHTTLATMPSQSTGPGLSTISETDREVMAANQDAKRRRGLDSLVTKFKTEHDGTSSSNNSSASSNSTNPHQYFSLASSPVALREGAVVPVDRFLTPMLRAHTTSTSTGGRSESTTSPTTTASVPVTHAASSSSGSSGEEPPTFVSYIDRQVSPELMIFREETMETSSQRASGTDDCEEREASPASEMMGYFMAGGGGEELMAPSQPLRESRLARLRQRPPRIPPSRRLGARPSLKTPPPLSSVALRPPVSPPRNMVDLPGDTNISRPHVRRSGSDPLMSSGIWLEEMARSPVEGQLVKGRTYQERSIEVLTASAEESALNWVTPEKV